MPSRPEFSGYQKNNPNPSLVLDTFLYLATVSTSNLLLARQSSMMTWGGCPSRLAVVQLFKTASEVKEVVGGGNTSMSSVSQAHFIALKISWKQNSYFFYVRKKVVLWWCFFVSWVSFKKIQKQFNNILIQNYSV